MMKTKETLKDYGIDDIQLERGLSFIIKEEPNVLLYRAERSGKNYSRK